MSVNNKPYPSDFIVNRYDMGSRRYFSNKFTYNDLLVANGDFLRDYTDLSQVAKQFYSQWSPTLSDGTNAFYERLLSLGVQDVDHDFVKYRIYSKPDRRAISMGNPNEDAEYYGVGGVHFDILLDVPWYNQHERLINNKNKRCILRIESDGGRKFKGAAYKYTVSLVESPDNMRAYRAAYLREGDYFLKLPHTGSSFGTATRGSIQFGWDYSYIEYQLNMAVAEYEFEVDEEAHEKWGNLEMARCTVDPDGQQHMIPGSQKLTDFFITQGIAQIEKEVMRDLIYGQKTTHLVDKITANPTYTIAGLYQFLEQGRTFPYVTSVSGLDHLMSILDGLVDDRVPYEKRHFIASAGIGAVKLFHEWVESRFANSAVTVHHDFVLGDAPPVDSERRGLSYGGYQFTKIFLPGFGHMTVTHDKFLDDKVENGIMLPGTHHTASSYQFIFYDTGFGEPKMRLLTRKSKDFSMIHPGNWSPLGKVGQDNPVWKMSGDTSYWGYRWIYRKSYGLAVFDADTMLRFVPNVMF